MFCSLFLLSLGLLAHANSIQAQEEIRGVAGATIYKITVGNVMCAPGHTCGFYHKLDYSWCYTDSSDNWDYCCMGPCKTDDTRPDDDRMSCLIGINLRVTCSTPSNQPQDDSFSVELNKIVLAAKNKMTVGNDMCRPDHKCEFHEDKQYLWCYTDSKNNWDYCCTSPCRTDLKKGKMTCKSGINYLRTCSPPGKKTVRGTNCRSGHSCGLHGFSSSYGYYWCFVDKDDNYEYCCHPLDTCSKKGYGYNWCHIGKSLIEGASAACEHNE